MIKYIRRALRRRQLRKELSAMERTMHQGLSNAEFTIWSEQHRAKCNELLRIGG